MKAEYNFKNAKKVNPDKVDPAPKVMVSLRIDPGLVGLIRDEADRQGIPYQTLINSIIHRYAYGELIDKEEARKIAI